MFFIEEKGEKMKSFVSFEFDRMMKGEKNLSRELISFRGGGGRLVNEYWSRE